MGSWHRDDNFSLLAFQSTSGFRCRHAAHHLECLFFLYTCCPSIFILTVGANLLCGDWNVGLGEQRKLPRQTVILRQTPAHPSPSLHLCDLQHSFRNTPSSLFLPPASFLRSLWEWGDASLNLITISKISHKNQHTWLCIRLVAGGTVLSHSKCLWKLRHWKARQYFAAILPKTGASIPDLTSKLQEGVKQGLTVMPWLHCNLGHRRVSYADSLQWRALMICSFHDSIHL